MSTSYVVLRTHAVARIAKLTTMRERITFTQKAGLTLDPALIRITDTSLRGPDFEAAREDRLTVALDELPTELQSLLADSHELHLRWESPHHYEQTRPFFSRIPPGFHLFYTPSNEAGKHS